jgi:hypothetical protein
VPKNFRKQNRPGQGNPRKSTGCFTAEEHDRLWSWLSEILVQVPEADGRGRGETHPFKRAAGHLESGSIWVFDNGWKRFSNDVYGHDAVQLVAEIMGGKDDPAAQAKAAGYARQWLADHPGKADWDGGDPDADEEEYDRRAQWSAENAQRALQGFGPLPGTPAEMYLKGRGITVRPGLELAVGYCADVDPRRGLGALVGVLVDSQDVTQVLGVALVFLDPAGRPELKVNGKKRKEVWFTTRDKETRRRAVFHIPSSPSASLPLPPPGSPQAAAELLGKSIVVEGTENALACAMAAPEADIYGVPGIGRIGRCGVTGDVILLHDNDGNDAKAKAVRTKAVDGLILGGL